MKFAKLSLAALMVLGVSAFADVQNIKVSGDAKLFYSTNDADALSTHGKGNLFSQDNSMGQAAANLAVTADLADGVKGKVSVTALTTLGLENNLVSSVWAGKTPGMTDTVWWANEAWLAKTFGNTTVKVGRQELDTPLAFSEKWNIAANSFDAAVVLNNDLPNTTLVAAYVGKGNGHNDKRVVNVSGDDTANNFKTYGSAIHETIGDGKNGDGAYAFAVITTVIPNVTLQGWYYNVEKIATAYWLQADANLKDLVPGLTFGAQYADINIDSNIDANLDDSKAWAVKLGYDFGAALPGLKGSVAYSSTDDDGAVDVANTATGLKQSQSKLYTEAEWNYGYVSAPATDAWKVALDYSMKDVADFGASYVHTKYDHAAKNAGLIDVTHGNKGIWNNKDVEMDEFALTASKSFGNLNAKVAYIYTNADDQNVKNGNADSYNTIHVYLTYNF